jgi:hypothetical protein
LWRQRLNFGTRSPPSTLRCAPCMPSGAGRTQDFRGCLFSALPGTMLNLAQRATQALRIRERRHARCRAAPLPAAAGRPLEEHFAETRTSAHVRERGGAVRSFERQGGGAAGAAGQVQGRILADRGSRVRRMRPLRRVQHLRRPRDPVAPQARRAARRARRGGHVAVQTERERRVVNGPSRRAPGLPLRLVARGQRESVWCSWAEAAEATNDPEHGESSRTGHNLCPPRTEAGRSGP